MFPVPTSETGWIIFSCERLALFAMLVYDVLKAEICLHQQVFLCGVLGNSVYVIIR